MDLYQHLLTLIAGVCFFMYGMILSSDNLQILAADRLRYFMSKISRNQIVGILSGIGLTVILQSSSAVTVMLVNLASAGVVTLAQVMGLIIGSAVGTTFTVQMISFNITKYSYYALILGFMVLFLSKSRKTKEIGAVVFGVGMVFYGLLLMGDAISIVRDVKTFREFFKFLSANPVWAFAITTFFTAMVHSSAVTIGLAMTLASKGVISIYDGLIWVYGANLGTTATALLASLGGSYVGRQVAWSHFFYKAASVLLALVLVGPFEILVGYTSQNPIREVANAHTILNIVSAILFFPFIKWGAQFIEKLFPRPLSEKEFGARYLDPHSLSEPAMAFAGAVRETLRMADYALEMVRRSPRAFEKDDPNFIEELKLIDKKVDILNREIKLYLVRLTDEQLNDSQRAKVMSLIALISDIENIGDVVDKNIIPLARKKSNLKVSFSAEGWKEIQDFQRHVVENFEMALSCFSLNNSELGTKVIDNKHKLRILEQQLREAHIGRLHHNVQESFNTSSIHLDLLSAYRRINSYACNLVYPVLNNDNGRGAFPGEK